MGQCYTVHIELKNVNKPLFIEKTKEYCKDWEDLSWTDTVEHILLNMLCKYEPRCYSDAEVEKTDTGYLASGSFDSSYSWHDCMTEWFETVAPALGNTSEMEVYPDSGMSKQIVEDGQAPVRYLENDEIVREDPRYCRMMRAIEDAIPANLFEDIEDSLWRFLGEYRDDSAMLEEWLTDEYEDEQIEGMPSKRILNKICKIIDTTK